MDAIDPSRFRIVNTFKSVVLALILPVLLVACGGIDDTTDSNSGTGTSAAAPDTGTSTPADTTAPVISITAPTTGSTYTATSASVTVSGGATDNVGLSQLSWTNSKGGSGSQTISGTSASGSFSIALVSGSNVITVTARDTAGNTAQKQLTVNYTPTTTTTSNSAALAWDAVAATNLSGYRVYYGTAPGAYLQAYGQGLSVGNVATYTLVGLSNGTRYYFAVTAFDTLGNESGYSNEAFKDIP